VPAAAHPVPVHPVPAEFQQQQLWTYLRRVYGKWVALAH
jgi:hypothetical protein